MKSLLLSILSGLLLTVGFPKPELYYLAWAALVPLLFAVRGKSARRALLLGYICGLTHYATSMLWVWHAIYYFGGVNFFAASGILLLLCIILAPFQALFAWAAQRLEKHPSLVVFALPFVWTALEWALTFAPFSGFPWTLIGYTQGPMDRLIQYADMTGVYGVSWLVVFANCVIFGMILGYHRKTGVPVLAACVVAAMVYGSWRIDGVRSAQSKTEPFKVSVIQPNIEQSVKWDPAFMEETFRRYRDLSLAAENADPSTDLLFWPESAMPFLYGIDDRYTPTANEIISETGKPVLFGTSGLTRVNSRPMLLNVAYLVDEHLNFLGSYAKQHLVPFGEYVPFSDVLTFIHQIVPGELQYVPGRQPGPIYLNGRAMGILVCYEVIFTEIPREAVRRGAGVLMNLTNDGWYGDTGGPHQHLAMSRWRAIENRVPIVRAAGTGISAAFDATGAEIGRIGLNREGFATFTVHPLRYTTIYTRFGDVFAWLCVFITFFALIFSYILNARRRPL